MGLPQPSPWVARFAAGVARGAEVLDVACGGGRHFPLFLAAGAQIVGVDRDLRSCAAFHATGGVTLHQIDLEDGRQFPFPPTSFDGVIVTNYLWRPILPAIVAAVAPGRRADLRDVPAWQRALRQARQPGIPAGAWRAAVRCSGPLARGRLRGGDARRSRPRRAADLRGRARSRLGEQPARALIPPEFVPIWRSIHHATTKAAPHAPCRPCRLGGNSALRQRHLGPDDARTGAAGSLEGQGRDGRTRPLQSVGDPVPGRRPHSGERAVGRDADRRQGRQGVGACRRRAGGGGAGTGRAARSRPGAGFRAVTDRLSHILGATRQRPQRHIGGARPTRADRRYRPAGRCQSHLPAEARLRDADALRIADRIRGRRLALRDAGRAQHGARGGAEARHSFRQGRAHQCRRLGARGDPEAARLGARSVVDGPSQSAERRDQSGDRTTVDRGARRARRRRDQYSRRRERTTAGR